jgi:hypothetical protein
MTSSAESNKYYDPKTALPIISFCGKAVHVRRLNLVLRIDHIPTVQTRVNIHG